MGQSRYTEHDYQLSNGAYVDFKVKEDPSGTPVISELRIKFEGDGLPIGGIGSSTLREIRTSDLMSLWFEESSRSFLTPTQEKKLWQKVKTPWGNTGRTKAPLGLYAALAYFYLKSLEQNPNNPTDQLAQTLQIPTKTLQKRMTQCRKLGLLTSKSTSLPSGRAGGKLSMECRQLITELIGD